jgi:hypothetical protein
MSQSVPIQIDIDPESLNIVSNDLKILINGIDKASKENIFNGEESESLCSSLNNIGNLIFILAKSVEKTIDKAEKIKKNNTDENHDKKLIMADID